ncbi:ParB/RepB/Spo0J family partition protein [Puniceicoccaceae bacterium K14]|nr:ParB/RepB/Spo0J family partition protein [Puniceicoccaceae bacterium K14]
MTQRVPLEQIDIYSGTQTRVTTVDEAVDSYSEAMKNGAEFPPIDLYFDGSKYYLADGFHRFLAAKRNEEKDIPAIVIEGSRLEALKHALGANATNGLYRTNADKRHAAEIALEEWPDLSNAYLADLCKVSIELVRRVRKAVGLDHPDHVLGKDGKKYPSKVDRTPRGGAAELVDGISEGGSSGEGGGGGGGKPSKKNANYNDAVGGGTNTELENEARQMIRNGEIDPRELKTLQTALPTDYAFAAINLLEAMDIGDSRYKEALEQLERWVSKKKSAMLHTV